MADAMSEVRAIAFNDPSASPSTVEFRDEIKRGVATPPGATALTRTSLARNSRAAVRTSDSNPAFAAPYAPWYGEVFSPLIDATKTIDPPPFAARRAPACFTSRNA